MSNIRSAARRRLSLLASSSIAAMSVLAVGAITLAPTSALALDECGPAVGAVYCWGPYPSGITYSVPVEILIEDAQVGPSGGLQVLGSGGDVLIRSVATLPGVGDLQIYTELTNGLVAASFGGDVLVDLTDQDSGDGPGSITGLGGVIGFSDLGAVTLVLDNVSVTDIGLNSGAIGGFAGGDIDISTNAAVNGSLYGIFAQNFFGGSSITITTGSEGDILASQSDAIGIMAMSDGAITIAADGDLGAEDQRLLQGVNATTGAGGLGGDVSVTVNGDVYTAGWLAAVDAVHAGMVGGLAVNFGIAGPATLDTDFVGLNVQITNNFNFEDVAVTVGDGATLTATRPIYAVNFGTGDTIVEIGSDVTFNETLLIYAAANLRSSITVGDNLTLNLQSPTYSGTRAGLYAYGRALHDDGGPPTAEIVVGENASIINTDAGSYDAAAIYAHAQNGTASAHVAVGDGLNIQMAGEYVIGVAAQTNAGDIAIEVGTGGIVLTGGNTPVFPPLTTPHNAGIGAASEGGDISVASGADIEVTANVAGAYGISGETIDEGSLSIVSGGDLTVQPEGLSSIGILAQAEDGDVAVTSNGTISAGAVGISGTASGAGSVDITANGDITADTGIGAYSGAGDVLVTTGADSDIVSDGFIGLAAQGGGSVTIVANGDVSATGNAIVAVREVYVAGPGGPGDPPPPVIPGDVDVTVNGDVTSASLMFGVVAQNNADTGEVTLRFGMDDGAVLTSGGTGLLAGNTSFNNADSVRATVGSGGAVTAVTGVLAATQGSGDVFVTSAGGSTIVGQTAGISATTPSGDVSVSAGGSVSASAGSAIRVDSGGAAAVTIGEAGLVLSSAPALEVTAAGAVTIDNSGELRSSGGGVSDLLTDITGGAAALNNDGLIQGAVDFSATDSLAFSNGGVWRTGGTSTFTAASDTLSIESGGTVATRAATIIDFDGGDDDFSTLGTLIVGNAAGASTLTLAGLESLASSGVILFGSVDGTTSDGEANDRLVAAGVDFAGGAGSTLVMDVDLGADTQANCDAALVADCFSLVGGSTAGSTLIRVNDTGESEGAINQQGIVVIDVEGGESAADHFALDPASDFYRPDASLGGVLAKGVFLYRLDYDAENQQHRLVGEPDRAVFELTPLAASAQNIWRTSAQTWLDHQAELPPEGRRSGGWVRVVASSSERDVTQNFGAGGAQFHIDVSHEQNTVGLQGGFDVVHEIAGGAVSAGVMLGSLDSDVRFEGSTARENFEGVSYGGYAGWSGGRAFVNALVMITDLDLEHRAGWAPDQGVGGVTSTGVQAEGGWRLAMAGLAFEPLAGLAYVRTSLDDLQLPGAELRTDDATSLRGSLGARVSGGSDLGTARMRFSATGRFWEEFEGDNRAVLLAGGEEIPLSDDFGGSFAEVGAGFSLSSASGGVTFFANAGVKFGDEYESTDGAIGLRVQW